MWASAKSTLAALLVSAALACDHGLVAHRHLHPREDTPRAPLSEEEEILYGSVSNTSISDWSYYYTHGAHLAGKNKTMATWTADRWAENGFDSSVISYEIYLNYPVHNSLSLSYANGSRYAATLEEAVLVEDETTSYPDRIPTFHGYSASGNVSAEYVYVGRGRRTDYQRLADLGVALEGKIAVAMYGGPFRGIKVKNAQEFGMIGTVLFTDPIDDGEVTEANGYAAYPDGPARNPSSVQRGSVQFISTYPGDPTTPGYPSRADSERTDKYAVVPRIPSLPISYTDAIPFLSALNGKGHTAKEVNQSDWVGALNVSYSSGPAPGATISLTNMMEDTYKPVWDSIGIINGTCPDETIIIGNHRDAWIVGGAADPNSGSSVMIELSKAFGKLLAQGWKPKRNIVLASWDAEEYGIVGSTEWVEEFVPWLNDTAVSYLNIDVGASGPNPYVDASPELHAVAKDTMKKVMWMATGRTMYDTWYDNYEGSLGVLGSGSDYTAFVHKGIGSLDTGSGGSTYDPIYHYHSNYDSYHWMSNFGDPEFLAHKSMCQFLTLLAYNLTTSESIPFDLPNWGTQMDTYYKELETTVESSSSPDLDLAPLHDAIDTFTTAAGKIDARRTEALQGHDSTTIAKINEKYRDFQRGFVSQGGLPEREFYKHLVFAPGKDTGYAAVTFPGITEALDAGNATQAAEFVTKTADAILVAAAELAM